MRGNHIGQFVWDYKAVEEGAGPHTTMLSGLNAALEAFAGVYRGSNRRQPRGKMLAKGRASIAAAPRARWAKVKGNKTTAVKPVKRTISASARRKIPAAQRARWAKVKRDKKRR